MIPLIKLHPIWRVTLREFPFYSFQNFKFDGLMDNGFKYWSIFARNHIKDGFPTLKGFYKLLFFTYIVISFTMKNPSEIHRFSKYH